MRKTYMQPQTTEVKILTENLMGFGASNGDGTADGGGNNGNYEDDMEDLSRHRSLWDEED